MKIIITLGISGSGKSSWSEQFIKDNENYIRLNRDSIRECFIPNHVYTWYKRDDVKNLERLVSASIDSLIKISNHFDKDIVIDNTHVNKHHLEALISSLRRDYSEVDISIKIFNTSLTVAQNRVYRRDYPELVFDTNQEYFDYSGMPEVEYIEHQYDNFLKTLDWVNENYKELII